MRAVDSALELIGNTPLVELQNMNTGVCRLFVKLEYQNPGGSIKDRIALGMIEAAERDGTLRPGGTIVEATAGNTGIGLLLVAMHKGYKILLVIPDKMSQEKIFHVKALGAEVLMTRSDVAKGHPDYYQDFAARLAAEMENACYINQFTNAANPLAHEQGTGPEIWEQMEHDLDAVVCGVGTCGTLTGLGRYFRRVAPAVEMVLADPEGSILAGVVNTGRTEEPGSWLVEGIGEDFVPAICDLSLVGAAYTISDGEAFETARELLRREGLFGGSSSGTLVAAALRYCRAQSEPKRVVTLLPDSGNKYLSKMYNDYWMMDQGFQERETFGDLRDLIARRHVDHATIVVSPDEHLLTAYARMKLYLISQMPVMQEDRIVGIIDESDVLLAVYGNEACFDEPVKTAMTRKLEMVAPSEPFEALMPIFAKDHVAIVMDGEQFLGLISRIDLLQYLRRRMPQ
ncbi:MAG: pyridoxal-phosphate dependent enzyme [Pseudomonadota bacterium]|nr:pyridoxal-phosphate dependent enzyme [Pseudomonadota bacterium]